MEPGREQPPALPPKTRSREQHSNLSHTVNGSASEEEHTNQEPPALPVVPPRFRAQIKKDKRPVSNGLPPTPKVHVSNVISEQNISIFCPLFVLCKLRYCTILRYSFYQSSYMLNNFLKCYTNLCPCNAQNKLSHCRWVLASLKYSTGVHYISIVQPAGSTRKRKVNVQPKLFYSN